MAVGLHCPKVEMDEIQAVAAWPGAGVEAKAAEATTAAAGGPFAVVKSAAPQEACSIPANTLALQDFHLVPLVGEDPKLGLAGTFGGHQHEKQLEAAQDKAAEAVHPEALVVAAHRLEVLMPAVNIVTEAI